MTDRPESSTTVTSAEDLHHGKYQPGQVIMSSLPWTYTILPELLEKFCYRCLNALAIVPELLECDVSLTCPNCAIPIYCSENCRTTDWEDLDENFLDLRNSELRSVPKTDRVTTGLTRPGRHQLECEAFLRASYNREDLKKFPPDFFLMLGVINNIKNIEKIEKTEKEKTSNDVKNIKKTDDNIKNIKETEKEKSSDDVKNTKKTEEKTENGVKSIKKTEKEKPENDVKNVKKISNDVKNIKKTEREKTGNDGGNCRPPTSRTFDCLLSHSEEFSKNEDRMLFLEELKVKLRKFLTIEEIPEDKKLLRIFGCLQINCFGIRTPFLMGVGEGLYLGPSIIDHSCDRNAVFLFDGPRIVIKAITEISSLADVRISYTELFVPLCVRQRRFRTGYFFECKCRLCERQNSTVMADMYPLRCSTTSCPAAIPLDERALLPCTVCGTPSFTKHTLSSSQTLVRRYEEGIEEIDDRIGIPEWNIADVIAECESVERKCGKMLHPKNLLLGMVYDRKARLLVTSALYSEAWRYFRKSLPAFRVFFRPFDTKLAVQILMTGLAGFVSGCFEEASVFLLEAKKLFEICDDFRRNFYLISKILLAETFLRKKEHFENPVDDEFCFLARTSLTLFANIRIEEKFHLLEMQTQLCLTQLKNPRK